MKKYIALLTMSVLFVAGACKKDEPNDTEAIVVKPRDFLSTQDYTKLIVEMVSVEGYEPSALSVDNLEAFLNERLNKSDGIEIVQRSIATPGKAPYTSEDINQVESKNRDFRTQDKTLTVFIFFADGDYNANVDTTKIFGIAYGKTSMVIFKPTIQEYSGEAGQPSEVVLESTVLKHEFSHLVGLVNKGVAMQVGHEDGAHPGHCNNVNCLMHWQLDNTSGLFSLVGGTIPNLDENCINDLKAHGGK